MGSLPFDESAFRNTFAVYNSTFWPVVLASWLLCAIFVAAAARRAGTYSRPLSMLLAFMWAWSAVAYHAWIFTRINPAAWIFSGLFAYQAVRLSRLTSGDVPYFSARSLRGAIGVGLTLYALAYPLVSWLAHPAYPALPLFNVPCPTAILTLGLLFTCDHVSRGDLVVPLIWAFVGGSAALLLGMTADYVLLAGGGFATAFLARRVPSKPSVAARPA